MTNHNLVIVSRPVGHAPPGGPGGTFDDEPLPVRVAARLGEARRSVSRRAHGMRHRPPRSRTARLLVLVPAHDEETVIARTLDALLTQTRAPDRIVVVADDCGDRTERIARRHRGVTVMRTVGNTDGTVGALNQAWRRWQAGYDVVARVDPDTVPAPDCLADLEDELAASPGVGGITARHPFDRLAGASVAARLLARAQRLDAARTPGVLPYRTGVRGGRATLFKAYALRQVAERNGTPGPWDATAQVGDMQLTGDLRTMRYGTLVSTTALASAGPRVTVRSLWHQQRTRDAGTARLLAEPSVGTWTAPLRRQRLSLLGSGVARLAFLSLLAAALLAGPGWSWWWAVPPAVVSLLNVRLACRMPHRTAGDVAAAALVVPLEASLWMRLGSATAARVTVDARIRRAGRARAADALCPARGVRP